MKIAWFRIVFENFVTSGPFEEMLSTDKTLSRNMDIFIEKAKVFIEC